MQKVEVVKQSLLPDGNSLRYKDNQTLHSFPSFLRTLSARIVAGSMLLGAVVTFIVAMTATTAQSGRVSCLLSCAICAVAFYHYLAIVKIRSQDAGRKQLPVPGDTTSITKSEVAAIISWQELEVDAVRYSDWLVTLPMLIVDLHMMTESVSSPVWFTPAYAPILLVLMVTLGAFLRFGTDELVPMPSNGDFSVRTIGVVAFILSSGCLFAVLYNLLWELDFAIAINTWVAAFTLPWSLYGVVVMISIVWRQVQPRGYPESLSVFKDVAFGSLDVWSKSVFALFVASRAAGFNAEIFSFE